MQIMRRKASRTARVSSKDPVTIPVTATVDRPLALGGCGWGEAEGVGEGCPLPLRLAVGLREAEMLPEAVSVR